MSERLNLRLKRTIFERFPTQRYFGAAVGLPEWRISAIVRCRVTPTEGERAAIAEALRSTPAYLFDHVLAARDARRERDTQRVDRT
jgi:hypothetical protein